MSNQSKSNKSKDSQTILSEGSVSAAKQNSFKSPNKLSSSLLPSSHRSPPLLRVIISQSATQTTMDDMKSDSMMANVYQGVGKPSKWMRVPKPVMEKDTDVIIKVHKTTICGTDLHILGGNVPQTKPGIILGHEGIGIIVEAGSAVQKYKVGDRILISCITACGHCESCKIKEHAHCTDGGWQFGTLINGMQAEFCRVCELEYLYILCFTLTIHSDFHLIVILIK